MLAHAGITSLQIAWQPIIIAESCVLVLRSITAAFPLQVWSTKPD